MNNKNGNGVQYVTTVLAYSLPLLQFFFGQLSGDIQNLFLFKSYFVVVSVFTAIVSYVMVIILRSTTWFEIAPFQRKKRKNLTAWQTYTNSSVYTNEEIKDYQSKNSPPVPLAAIRPDNIIPKVFLPVLLASFTVFMALGLVLNSGSNYKVNNVWDMLAVLAQALAYAFFLVFSVLSFAHQYIRDSGQKKWEQNKNNKYEKAIQLARQRDAFCELKKISLVSQKDPDIGVGGIMVFLVKVDDKYCVLITNSDVDTIVIVKQFDNLQDANDFMWGSRENENV